MANICKNTITVIGLRESSETFVKALSMALFAIDLDNPDPKRWGESEGTDGKSWYNSAVEAYRREGVAEHCILYPNNPYDRLGITAPRFYFETKWEPPVQRLVEASRVFPGLKFHLEWWILPDGPSGEAVISNGAVKEELLRGASWYLFDPLIYPATSLLPAHLPYTLAQHAALRLQDACHTIGDLRRILDDDNFRNSPYTPFSEFRDQDKTERLRADLTALKRLLEEQASQLDFSGVFIERRELEEGYSEVVKANERLMQSLGVEPLLLKGDEVIRFSILPFAAAATIGEPDKTIVSVVQYLNADPASGKYKKQSDGLYPPIEWQIRYMCFTKSDLMQMRKLPDSDQTLSDIDVTLRYSDGRLVREFNQVSNQARWKKDPEAAEQITRKAAEMSASFVSKVASKSGFTISNDVVGTLAA